MTAVIVEYKRPRGFLIDDPATLEVIDHVARRLNISRTEVVKQAVLAEAVRLGIIDSEGERIAR